MSFAARTMLDLIRTAYAVDADKVYGGPSWLDYDRFDVIAKAPATARPDAVKLMLQALLADRFKLVVKRERRPVPGYVLRAGKSKPNLKPAEGAGSSGCQSLAPTIGDVPYGNLQCRNVTMEAFAPALRRIAGASFGNLPVVDSTGIEGAWDIDLKYPLRVISLSAGTPVGTGNNGGIFRSGGEGAGADFGGEETFRNRCFPCRVSISSRRRIRRACPRLCLHFLRLSLK